MKQEDIDKLAKAISAKLAIFHKEVLSMEEAEQYTGLKKNCLYKLTADRKIPHSKPNGKTLYFRREDLDEWLMSNPVATDEQLTDRAYAYCNKKRKRI